MRIYIKGDYTKEIPFDYMELAKRMWFENYQGEGIPLSYSGFLKIRDRNDIAIHLKLDKQDYDELWLHVPIQEGIKYRFFSQIDEELNLDYEDDKKTWLTIEEFKEKYQDILSLTFDEANEMSLEEIQTIDAIDDPIWEELDRKREEYIQIHGERVYDDEEDE